MNRSAGGGMPGVGSATSQSGAGAPLEPTWQGYCGSTMDALYLIEWCLRGNGKHVPRRPHDRERADLIASGNIFIYEEHASGIKRWTDGVPWSPSRILGNFLIYRELDKPFEPGQKKKAKPKKENGVTKATSNQRSNSIGHAGVMAMGSATTSSAPGSFSSQNGSSQGDAETRALVGSLVDSYQFKQDGLIKKTISLSYNNITHHIVSYYTIEDVKSNILHRPSETFLRSYPPRPELIQSSNFRAPVDDNDIFVMPDDPRYGGYGDPRAYDDRYMMQGMYHAGVPRSMSVPTVPSVPGLHIGGYAAQYVPQQNYPVQHSPTTTMPPAHALSTAYSSSPSSTYPYTHGSMQQQQQQQQQRYPSQDQNYAMAHNPPPNTLRRANSVYELNNGTTPLSFTAPTIPRSQLSNSTVLPSNGEANHSLNYCMEGKGAVHNGVGCSCFLSDTAPSCHFNSKWF
ncbi:Gti1/Pac2 family-domain-containing protein [Truncatella angustata]|uniref:Gti1/Pac2 family-domain-containing protein n=1 Tax=Truncatella angustata TaxID=152316 RepID=A0A9P8UZI7_9PEZI|nr:Gti1/Pac2 family-domain-containing protein [Truncatella angustata]KAH6661258.1 Gti1/Pac2 family-domain-containing protein [Truncatella angustata]